jgi:hypothetical protein
MAQRERNRSALDRGNRYRTRQVFPAGSAQRGISRFRIQPSCLMLQGCLILAIGGPDA